VSEASRVLALLDQALALEPAARPAFIGSACGENVALRDELEALLRMDAEAEGFLQPIAVGPAERTGEQVGPWRLLRELGRGGMGQVYLAERADTLYSKQVALKLLRFDFGDLRARFANERRILAALDHPNIARLLDAGADAGGAPYVAMEYVEGQPITQWCETHALDTRARVDLFLKVLDAVQSAHGRLIVHRDLKPANILVDARGEPKLLDFGIAKLVDSDTRGLTLTGIAPLTPEYASPEQIRGEPIGTASDIYALGVLLYELVTGARPYRIASNSPIEIENTVCHAQPAMPSVVARERHAPRIDHDLDHVIMKALAKSPGERYASCAHFADDLRRFLGAQPVLATQAGWRYRAGKFVHRHRLAVTIATLVAAALIGSASIAFHQASAAHEQARVARIERDRTQRVNAFLQTMLAAADPGDLGRNVSVLDVLNRAQRRTERELEHDPDMLVATELTLAKTYTALGEFDAARHAGELALEASRQLEDPTIQIEAQLTLGATLYGRGDFSAAYELLTNARNAALAKGTPRQQGNSANQLGLLEDARGNAAQAQRWLEIALRELPADALDARAEALNDLALIKGTRGDFAGALVLQRQAVDSLRSAYPKGHPLLAQALSNLAVSLDDNGQRDAAGTVYGEALKMKVDLLGEEHPNVVMTLGSLTYHDVVGKDTTAALEHGARAWAAAQKLPEDHPAAGYAANTYAQALLLAGRPKEAVSLIQTSLRIRKAHYPPDHPLVVNTESVLGLAQAQAGDIAAGTALARSSYERQRAKLGEAHEMTIAARQRLLQAEAIGPSQDSR
jgi:serine/threonine-protein kinase